jgi:hypothetical protein
MRTGGALALLVVAMLVLAGPASAEKRLVAAGGSTSGNCTDTAGNPPCEIKYAIETVAAAGDEVVVAPGDYTPAGTVAISVPLTVHGVDGQPRPRMLSTLSAGGAITGTVIRHLEIDVAGLTFSGQPVSPGTAVIEDAILVGSGNVFAAALSNGWTMRDSLVRETSANVAAVQVTNGPVTLRNVTAIGEGSGSTGINVVFITGGMCDASTPGSTVAAMRNVIARGTAADLRVGAGICTSPHATINVSFSNYRPDKVTVDQGGELNDQGDNQSGAPLFADSVVGDYHQQPGSPTINAGKADPFTGATDFDGDPRTLGTAPDIGADEFRELPAATTGTALDITTSSATVTGSVDPRGSPTTYLFNFGKTATYGSQTPSLSAGSAAGAQSVTAALSGLDANTVYHYQLVAVNDYGTTLGADATFQTTALPPVDTVAPVFASSRVTPATFAVNTAGAAETPVTGAARKGTTFVYSLSEPARVVFAIQRKLKGRRVGGKCRPPSRSNRRRRACTRFVRAGAFAQLAVAGQNRKRFSGKIGKRKLKPGKYRATLTATDAAGNRSSPRRLNFKVVRR